MDKEKIARAVRDILEAIGEDPDREGLKETPDRVARMYEEVFSGLTEDAHDHLKLFNEKGNDELVVVRDIPLYSMCEHHLLPFVGKAHIAYIPSDGKIIGLSKLARIVNVYAKRPQVQERLTTQIADFLYFINNALHFYHSAMLPSLCLHTGFFQLCGVLFSSIISSLFTSTPSPAPFGISTQPFLNSKSFLFIT